MSSPTAEDGSPARLPARVASSARHRRLSAILHADVTGYVRLMEGAEDRTVSRLKSARTEVWQPAIEAAGGRIVNIVADSVLAEFCSAVATVAAAIDIQERMARFNDGLDEEQRLKFRIGLHLGEVIVDETQTIFGDAVNIAARIQLMAEPGGIAASRAIRDATHSQIDCAFVDGGKHHARNVSRSLQIYHVRTRESASAPLPRTASRMRSAGIRGPALWGAIAAATVLLAGGGYLAFTANPMTPVNVVALTLSAEQLEQALDERRKADALAAETRRLEEQARQRAETEAEARRQADLELEAARQARQKAERDLAQLKADIEARRKAGDREADQAAVTAQRAAEEAAQRKAEAEAASLRQAEEEAAKKAAAATRRPDDDAETTERRLRLEPADRRRLQVALTSLGFDTRGDDGVFGQRSREMIAHWQKARNHPATGFVTRSQQQALLKEAAAALSKYGEQRKIDEERKGRTTIEAPVAVAGPTPASADGLWRGTYECGRNGNYKPFTLRPEVRLKGGVGTWYTASSSPTNDHTIGISVSIDGASVRVTRQGLLYGSGGANASAVPLLGRLEGNSIRASNSACTMALTRDASPVHATRAPAERPDPATAPVQSTVPIAGESITVANDGTRSLPSPDGLWRGTYECGRNGNSRLFTLRPELHLKSGAGTWYAANTLATNGQTISVSVSMDGTAVRVTRRTLDHWNPSPPPLLGRLEGDSIRASNADCTMVLARAASSAVAATPATYSSAATPASYSSAASPALPSPDGLWRGTYECNASLQTQTPFVIDLKLHLTNGSATWRSAGPSPINGGSFDVTVSVVRDTSSVVRTTTGSLSARDPLTGHYDGATIKATGRERSSNRDCTLALTRS